MNNKPECQLHTLELRGLGFKVQTSGSGKPVLLLHGFPDDHQVWHPLIPLLVDFGYQVISFDQRGCGDSDAPVGRKHYKIRQLVDDIPGILEQLNIDEPVRVISHDWGAVIGWGLSLFYPERVSSHVVLSVGHPQSYGRAGLEQKLVKGLYTLWFQFNGLAECYLQRGGLARWLKRHDDKARVLKRMARPGRLSAALNWYRANILDILFAKWPRCEVPTLGIWSSDDPYLTEKQMQYSEHYMDANWQYFRLNDIGHWIPLEAPVQLAEKAHEWFKQSCD